MPVSNRQADELHLSVLNRAQAGEAPASISSSLHKAESYARVIIDRIRSADLRESGECPQVVLTGYPATTRNLIAQQA